MGIVFHLILAYVIRDTMDWHVQLQFVLVDASMVYVFHRIHVNVVLDGAELVVIPQFAIQAVMDTGYVFHQKNLHVTQDTADWIVQRQFVLANVSMVIVFRQIHVTVILDGAG